MPLSYYAARANLYYLWQHHPDWSHAELAAALGCEVRWVEKWLKRFREELAAGQRLDHVLQGHLRARKTPPSRTQRWWSSRSWPYAISLPKACAASRVKRRSTTT